MRLSIFYHVWSYGKWHEPLVEFANAARRMPVDEVCFGVVGSPWEPGRVWKTLYGSSPRLVACEQTGYEWVTINALRRYALDHDGAVLYAHTKGAEHPTEHNRRWRRAMHEALLDPGNVEALADHDAVGPFWIVDWPQQGNRFFGGNFWMARCDYLRTLPECGSVHRWVPESWLGLNDPSVVDVLPGVPGPEFFGLSR